MLGFAVVGYSRYALVGVFEVLFALFIYRFLSWFGMEYYRCN